MRALCRAGQTFIHINTAAATRGKGLIIELVLAERIYQLADIKILHKGEKLMKLFFFLPKSSHSVQILKFFFLDNSEKYYFLNFFHLFNTSYGHNVRRLSTNEDVKNEKRIDMENLLQKI